MTRTRCRGFSLIELMVAMVIALFVIGVAASSYLASKRMYSTDDQSARMQENARLGMELIEHDFRMAGYKGCVGSNGAASMYISYLNSTALLYNFVSGVQGYHGVGGTWIPVLDPTLSGLAHPPLINTDVLVTRFPATAPIGLSAPMLTVSGTLPVAASGGFLNPFTTGDILMVSDCKNAAVFQMTSTGPGANPIDHVVGPGVPGNNSAALNKVYSTDAQVVKMVTAVYYIAPSAILPGVNSLWCLRSDGALVGGVPAPQEMVLNVDDLKVRYGEDTSASPNAVAASGYWPADSVANFGRVVSLQVSLLVSSPQTNGTQGLGPQTYYFNGATTTAADNRLYLPFESVMTLRNRTP